MTTATHPTAKAPQTFSWGRLIADMKITGVPAMIAVHCEPTKYDASVPSLMLELKDTMFALERSPSMSRLKAALQDYFGDELQLQVVPGPAKGSLAEIAQAKRIDTHLSSLKAVMDDEVVRDLIETFDAKIVVETVEPSLMPAGARRPA